MPELIPWERQPGEPNRWFGRFERFRMAGSARSIQNTVNEEKASKGQKKPAYAPGSWRQAADRWRWRERAELWDEHERQQIRATHAKEIAEMNATHVREAKALQAKAIERLRTLGAEALTPNDVLRIIVEAAKLERTARGEPEVITQTHITGAGGGAIHFTIDDAVNAIRELEAWAANRLPPSLNGAPLEA